MNLSIICPTILGRETMLAATLNAYRDTLDFDAQVIVPQGHATVGDAWNEGARHADGDLLLFAIDDAVPHIDWYEAGLAVVEADAIPSPTLYLPDGSLEGAGSMGGGAFLPLGRDGVPCRSAGIILVTKDTWWAVGEFAPIHYYCDDDWCWRAHSYDIGVRVSHGFAFDHQHHPKGRSEMQARAAADQRTFLTRCAS